MTSTPLTRPTLAPLLITIVFFFTGFAALLYQVVWQRMLGLFAGSDVLSVTLITGAYLAGLGLGSLLGSLIADLLSSRRAVLIFGLINLGIALFAASSRYLYYDLLFIRFIELARYPPIMFLVLFASLLVPTTLMGLSLPLLARAFVRTLDTAANRITLLYMVNTLGAGFGSLITGWYLIGTFGFDRALAFGASLSALAGVVALALAHRFDPHPAPGSENAPPRFAPLHTLHSLPPIIWQWSLLVFLSGFLFISLEILWFRIIQVTIESTAYLFGHMLAYVLIGDALGSRFGAIILPRIHHPRRAFFLIQGVLLLYCLVTLGGIGYFGDQFLADAAIRPDPGNTLNLLISYGILPMVVIFVPSWLVGVYYPIVQKAIQTDVAVVGQRVGLVEVANILGNTAGAIFTGILLLNIAGTPGTLRLLGVVALGFMALLLIESWKQWTTPRRLTYGLLTASLVLAILFFPQPIMFWRTLHYQSADHIFIVHEDSTGIAAVARLNDGPTTFFANGVNQGAIPYLDIHALLGAMPALIHPNPQHILVIGIGSSGTPYAAATNPTTDTVTAVEIIAAEIDVLTESAATDTLHGPFLQPFLSLPRIEVVLTDGRRLLAQSTTTYDIIEADAIYPWHSHAGLLYSREFFETARRKLAPGGFMFQWVPTLRSQSTFIAVFPYVVRVGPFMIGSDTPVVYDPDAVIARLREPAVTAHLQAAGLNVENIVAQVPRDIQYWTPDVPRPTDINTDLHPKDEYYLNNP